MTVSFGFKLRKMKTVKAAEFLERLKTDTRQIILQTNYLLQQDPAILMQQPAAGKWNIAQIIEHLNSYGRYYLPLMKASMQQQRHTPTALYTPGWLGNYFADSMLPKADGKIGNKMQSPKNHRPSSHIESKPALEEFLKQEYVLLELLEQAGNTNLEKIRIPISLSRFIKIKLGDTFRFLIAHHQRHFVQIQNTLTIVTQVRADESAVA
jgi:hypothetical protein